MYAVPTVPVTFDAFRLDNPYPLPVCKFALKIPPTDKEVNWPTLVIFGCAGFTTEYAVPTVPTTFPEFKLEIAEPLEMTARPCTDRPVRVPTEVMLGWAGVTTESAVPTVPTTFPEFKLEIAEPLEAIKRPWTFSPVSVPVDVMFG